MGPSQNEEEVETASEGTLLRVTGGVKRNQYGKVPRKFARGAVNEEGWDDSYKEEQITPAADRSVTALSVGGTRRCCHSQLGQPRAPPQSSP